MFQVLDHAMNGPDGKDNCSKFVDILGLRTIFPLFMKTPTKNRKRMLTAEEHEGNKKKNNFYVILQIIYIYCHCRTCNINYSKYAKEL